MQNVLKEQQQNSFTGGHSILTQNVLCSALLLQTRQCSVVESESVSWQQRRQSYGKDLKKQPFLPACEGGERIYLCLNGDDDVCLSVFPL